MWSNAHVMTRRASGWPLHLWHKNVTPVAQNSTHVRALPTKTQKLSSPLQKSRAHSAFKILQFTDVLEGDFLGNFYRTGDTPKNC